MYPILGRYGPFFLYSYTVVMGLGLAAWIGLSAWFVKKEKDGQRFAGWLDGLLVGLAAAFVGGRIGFVWANWSYFLERPDEIWLVWQGGLSYHGALVCGLLVFWLWTLRQRTGGRTFSAYAAVLMPGLALAHVFGWLACWLEGCAFGRETVIGWFSADLPDSFGVFAVRYQTQVLGFLLTLLVFLAALLLAKRLTKGPYFWVIFGLVQIDYGLVTLFRGDVVPMIGLYRLDTLLSFGLVFVSLVGLVLKVRGNGR